MRRVARFTRWALLACAALTTGCGDDPTQPEPSDATDAPPRATAPTESVLALELASFDPPPDLAAALATPEDELDAEARELLEFARGMASLASAGGDQAGLASGDVKAEGVAAVRPLMRVALDESTPMSERRAALELIAAVELPLAARALAHVATVAGAADPTSPLGASQIEGAWLRRYAAWVARELAAVPGADAAVPAFIKRLKYEPDGEARVWLACTLAEFENLSGVDALVTLAGARDSAATVAATELARLVEVHGASDGPALVDAWTRGTLPAEPGAPSEGARAAVWRFVSDVSGQHFQLRGVDDARYVLARHGAWAAHELARALSDEDPFVRLHVAQALERMGPRAASGAFDALIVRLDDANSGVAGAAAEALVAVVDSSDAERRAGAADALRPLTAAHIDHELRVAAVRSLGRLELDEDTASLEDWLQDESLGVDLRIAAAEGLVARGEGRAAVAFLVGQLDDPIGDAGTAEALLGRWLESERGRWPKDDDPAGVIRDAWHALAPPAERVHRPDEVRARRAARAALVTTLLPRIE